MNRRLSIPMVCLLITRPDMSNTSIEATLVVGQMPSTFERGKCHCRNRVGRLADQIFAGSKLLILEPPDIRLAEDMVAMRSSYQKKKINFHSNSYDFHPALPFHT